MTQSPTLTGSLFGGQAHPCNPPDRHQCSDLQPHYDIMDIPHGSPSVSGPPSRVCRNSPHEHYLHGPQKTQTWIAGTTYSVAGRAHCYHRPAGHWVEPLSTSVHQAPQAPYRPLYGAFLAAAPDHLTQRANGAAIADPSVAFPRVVDEGSREYVSFISPRGEGRGFYTRFRCNYMSNHMPVHDFSVALFAMPIHISVYYASHDSR